ncbi:MAG: glycosyltransferase [Candidatus Methanoperedens sp.]|jgi:hypothetical protein|nr:glycosyltransferase [Candidatus Methanoperedens sp.]
MYQIFAWFEAEYVWQKIRLQYDGGKSGSQKKMHVLSIGQNWSFGPDSTVVEDVLLRPLEASGLATHDLFHFDEYYHIHKQSGDISLLELCIESKPDIMFLTWDNRVSWRGLSPDNPRLSTLKIIAEKMRIPIVALWADSVWHIYTDNAEMLLPYVKFHILFDSSIGLTRTSRPDKFLVIWAPIDPRIYYNSGVRKDIPIVFLGSMDKPGRKEGIEALKSNGINIYHGGGIYPNDNTIPFDEYVQICMRVKIMINFSRSAHEFQLKGRIFEGMSYGAMLLEEDNPEIRRFFEPMVDYVPFTNEADLVEKAKYYLEHEAERAKIASNGHRKVKEKYNISIWFKTVFDRAFEGNSWEDIPNHERKIGGGSNDIP